MEGKSSTQHKCQSFDFENPADSDFEKFFNHQIIANLP